MIARDDLDRIEEALAAAKALVREFGATTVRVERKHDGEPVTEADRAVDDLLRSLLQRPGEGWLSEETRDDGSRMACSRVWVVDPIDGTKEFLESVPEWCVSIALVVDRAPIVGGTVNPARDETFVGEIGRGVRLNGERVSVSARTALSGATVLASRSEFGRGEWDRHRHAPFAIRPTGSIAYKMSLVAAGIADATWSFRPKSEWDVAAGVALVRAAGGEVRSLHRSGRLGPSGPESPALRFNQKTPGVPGLLCASPVLADAVERYLTGDATAGAPS